MQEARHDYLTGLPNRKAFGIRLNIAMDEYHRSGHKFAVLFIDLSIKLFKYAYGHSAVDKVLTIVAKRLKECIGSHDTVARLDGGEFTILLTQIHGLQDVQQASDRIIKSLRQPDCTVVKISSSIGAAISGSEFAKPDDILDAAYKAMCAARKPGNQS
ncbi:MAG: GGDEF domain-containing protein [Planctomycetes bacterium]|nr:GGDEF domain-containing protein [Planctomycetota bacterium]